MNCFVCEKKLIDFTKVNDWKSRKMHKSCWVKRKKEIDQELFFKQVSQRL